MKYEIIDKGGGPKLKCPKCGEWMYLDDDQYHGRVSVFHDVPKCGYHEKVNFLDL